MSTRTATRALSRWMLSIGLTLVALVTINLLLVKAPTQARRAAALINCSGSIQACINAANDGDTILIAAGRYTESLTLSKAVSLTGVSSDTTIIHAVAYQRVLTVTGAAISNSVVISGLTFTGGDTTNGQGIGIIPHPSIIYWPSPTFTPIPLPTTSAQHALRSTPVPHRPLIRAGATGRPIPLSWQTRQSLQDFNPARDGVGGGILITNSARPELQFVRVISNIGGYGGGLYVHSNSTVTLSNLDVFSNVAVHGGGLLAFAPATLLQVNLGDNYGILGGGAQVSGTMTLSNSTVAHNEGGGLYVEGDLTLHRSNVDFNTSLENWGGGGIVLIHGTLNLADSMIEGNQGWPWEPHYPDVGPHWGSGVFLGNSRAWITNTQFLHNSAYKGGGLMLFANSSGQVVNTLFAQNSSTVGGASINIEGKLYIVHSTIADTNLNPQPAIFFEIGTLYITDTKITSHTVGIQLPPLGTGAHEDYNLFFGNLTNTVGVITGGHSLIGDPKFVDPLNGNYHLQSDSAAIDHGVDAGIYADLDGHPRPFGAGFDIGAYEYMVGPRYVATTGNDSDNDCLNQASPCAMVQHAINVANDGEQVLIASGLYTQSATLYKPVSLTGISSDTTILHAVDGQRVLTVTGATISNSVVISGLTFTGGEADYGGGVLITNTAQPLIRNSIFLSNVASVNGGGVYAQSDLTLLDSQIISNAATELGGGVFASQSLMITSSEFISNYTTGSWPTYFPHGGGIYAQMTVFIVNSRFVHNSSFYGGGLFTVGPLLTLIDTDFMSNAEGGAIALSNSSTSEARISGGHFSGNSGGSGLEVAGPLVMTGTQFLGNTGSAYGGGVHADGPLSISASSFVSNSSLSQGGAVYAKDGADIAASYFEGNRANDDGGGLYVEGFTSIADSYFISNAAGYNGGGAYFWGDAIIEGTHVERNSSAYKGGGFHVTAIAHISGTSFISNVARNNAFGTEGGGLWANAAIVTNSQFLSNSAQVAGGMKVFNGSITGSRFESNVASLFSGGGLEAFDISITDTDFYNNSAMAEGGGAYLLGPVHVIERVSVQGNHAAVDGGGLYIGGPFQMINTQLSDNTAGRNGGAIWQAGYSSLPSSLTNVLFADNLAEGAGSAIFASNESGPGSVALQHATLTDRALNSSSAIAVLTGTLYLTNTIIASHTIAISNTGGTVYEDYNLFFGNITNTVSVTSGGHSLIGDPKFVDPLHGNYHLRFDSAAIDHGVDAGIYTDLDGNPRPFGTGFDIGAYEFAAMMYRVYLPVVRK